MTIPVASLRRRALPTLQQLLQARHDVVAGITRRFARCRCLPRRCLLRRHMWSRSAREVVESRIGETIGGEALVRGLLLRASLGRDSFWRERGTGGPGMARRRFLGVTDRPQNLTERP